MLLPLATLLASGLASGDSLLQIYEKAVHSDPLVREAEANRLATVEGRPIARGALLPQVTASGSYTKGKPEGKTTRTFSQVDQTSPTQDIITFTNTSDGIDYTNKGWSLQIQQILFQWDAWKRLSQAGKASSQADVDYQASEQDLIVRVSEAYFNVLAAEDSLASEQASKEAIARQLEQAKKRFEVGLIAITDVQEAQSAFDSAAASEILAKRTLANQKEALRAITDDYPQTLAKPAEDLALKNPDPSSEDQWVDTAMRQNAKLISAQIGAEIAKDDVQIARAGHYPSLSLVGTRTDTNNQRDEFTQVQRGSLPPGPRQGPFPSGSNGVDDSIALQLAVPIFSGGSTSARVQQAVYRHRAARERLERTARETERQTRDAYLGVITDISRIQALKQAFESAKTALKATEAGYDVGTRTTVDVLAARRTVFSAETNYLRSRYDYLINGLRLKQAAGTLTADDIAQIDTLLTATTGPATPAEAVTTPVAN
ncbi:MAG: TolC family outer membrane protein [Gammaproteobacteria bacterium]